MAEFRLYGLGRGLYDYRRNESRCLWEIKEMKTPFQSLLKTGTRLWLDSIDPELVQQAFDWGFTGATSNPVIVADLVQSGKFDDELRALMSTESDEHQVAWKLNDFMVNQAEHVFKEIWNATQGDDGYVSFEVDPLLEDPDANLTETQRVAKYVDESKRWSQGHSNRLIKIPATDAGIIALEEVVAQGIRVNVTLIFTSRQYTAARDAIWRGAQRQIDLSGFKSVYSIFVSRVDTYTATHLPDLSPAVQGMVGIVNAQQIWAENQTFWQSHATPLQQEIVFASTGTKNPEDPPWKYVAALAGGDIQTNPPATNQAVADAELAFESRLQQLPADEVVAEIEDKVDMAQLEETLMEEGIKKFADPQRALAERIAARRDVLASS